MHRFWPRREFLLIGRGDTGSGAAGFEIDLAVEAQTFAVTEEGKCSVTIGDLVGVVALDKQVVQYIADSVATCNMTPDADGLTNYRECSRPLGLANGEAISIVGYGALW